MIFYTLLAKFSKSKGNANIWTGPNGVHLISKLFITLSTIVQNSGFFPGSDMLASELYTFALSFKESENAEVRRAVLLSLTVCIPYLSETVHMESIYDRNGLLKYLDRIQIEDSDEQCRNLATMISSNISKVVGFSQQSMDKIHIL